MRCWRERVFIDSAGRRRVLMIRRLVCLGCKRIHHELPDCIVPYKRHCADTIEAIAAGQPEGVPCDGRVIRRIALWWEVMLPYYINILKSLAEKYKMSFHTPPAFREIVRAVVNSNSWMFDHFICTRSA